MAEVEPIRIREQDRANQARALLENPLWVAAWDELADAVLDQWQSSPVRDSQGREYLFLMLKAQRQVRELLTEHIETGTLAEIQIERSKDNG